jgi:hypothetical protein
MCASWSRREQWRRWEKTCVTKSTIVYVHVYVDSFFFFLLAGIKRKDLRARWWPEGIRFVGTAFKCCCCCCYHFVLLFFFFFFSPRCCVCSLYSLPYLSLSLSLCSVYLFYYIVHLLFPFLYYTTTPVISSSYAPPNRKKKTETKLVHFPGSCRCLQLCVWAFAGLAGGLYSNDCVELEESYRNDRAAIEKKKKKKQKQRVSFVVMTL